MKERLYDKAPDDRAIGPWGHRAIELLGQQKEKSGGSRENTWAVAALRDDSHKLTGRQLQQDDSHQLEKRGGSIAIVRPLDRSMTSESQQALQPGALLLEAVDQERESFVVVFEVGAKLHCVTI